MLLFAGVASAQEQSRTYRVPFRSVNGMILLDGQLNGTPALLLLDTGARVSIADVHDAELEGLKLDPLRPRGSVGAEGTCVAWEVRLSLEHRSWLTRRVCVMDTRLPLALSGERQYLYLTARCHTAKSYDLTRSKRARFR